MALKADGTTDRDGVRHPGGRPPHVPTQAQRDEVRRMAALDVPHRHIAVLIGVSETALSEHYARDLAEGWAEGAMWLVNRLRQSADGGARWAQKLLAANAPRLAAFEALAARGTSTAGPPGDAAADGFGPKATDPRRAGSPPAAGRMATDRTAPAPRGRRRKG
ncbi:MAG: hypothetical protein ICV73_29855 [Acetobacteraceae bacterium]|nr:hypothetical protein [Acetobacteraceae bacterium]